MRPDSRRFLLALVLMASAVPARLSGQSQTNPVAIQFIESRKIFLLTTRESSYAMGVSADGTLQNLYWGAPLWRADDLAAASVRRDISSFDPRQMLENEEFPGWGGTALLRARAEDHARRMATATWCCTTSRIASRATISISP